MGMEVSVREMTDRERVDRQGDFVQGYKYANQDVTSRYAETTEAESIKGQLIRKVTVGL